MGRWSASPRQGKLEALLRTAVPDGGRRRFETEDWPVSLDAAPHPPLFSPVSGRVRGD